MPTSTTPDVERIRRAFPALASPTVFLENAGGSQVPLVVAERIREYMLKTYVQLGAGYRLSRLSTETVDRAHDFVGQLMNAGGRGRVILGPSTTALLSMLAACYRPLIAPGEEIVVAEAGHEANVGPWLRLEACGAVVKTWRFDPAAGTSRLEDLEALLSPRTRVVAFPHVSNLLGEICDVAAITKMVHRAGARVVVDGVAYAPHRLIDVAAWDVDWYVYSTYKVYGPHMGALFGTAEAMRELHGPSHFFIPQGDEHAFEPGGVSHEGCAGILGLGEYLLHLTGRPAGAAVDRAVMREAGAIMTECERPLIERLIGFLRHKPAVRLVGPSHSDDSRVGTISFVHAERPSREIAERAWRADVGIRHGHMYAPRLCRALNLDPDDGVVRVSLVHYNNGEDIERCIEVLEGIL